ncbi:MAG: class I SAM-dependent methyltransferase [Pseudomonadales bacterium]|nr:class I SAM-dependent methyltransferase [Pseudomonadales bacterium]MCP5184753.1 class I SAM-dependent methyltransferase [Pseudomonadales bacterium]
MTQTTTAAHGGPQPSQRYQELLRAYRQLHDEGSPELGIESAAMFPGQSLVDHVATLLALSQTYGFRTMLDYGCGKAMMYRPVHDIRLPDGRRASCVQQVLGVDATLFDPGYLPYSERPAGRFDLVVCTDVLEHCDEQDLPWIVEELFSYAKRFVFANVACYPARKTLPNGENAHCTIKSTQWWRDLFANVSTTHPDIDFQVVCTRIADGQRVNDVISRP